jgi:hypothetical protein
VEGENVYVEENQSDGLPEYFDSLAEDSDDDFSLIEENIFLKTMMKQREY